MQAQQFEMDKGVHVLQMDFAMAYECQYQNEVQSALWSRGSVILFIVAAMYKGQVQSFLICIDCNSKDKDTVLVFVEYLYENFLMKDGNMLDTEEIIWTDGPSSEFKNKYTVCQ